MQRASFVSQVVISELEKKESEYSISKFEPGSPLRSPTFLKKKTTFESNHSSEEEKGLPELDEFGKKICALPDKIKIFMSMFDKKPIFQKNFKKKEKEKIIPIVILFLL